MRVTLILFGDSEHAGLGIPVYLLFLLCISKPEMLVPVCINAYVRKGIFRSYLRSENSQQTVITPNDLKRGPKQKLNTVCTLGQYLKYGSIKMVLLPQSQMLKRDQHFRSLSSVKTAPQYTNHWEYRDPHNLYNWGLILV